MASVLPLPDPTTSAGPTGKDFAFAVQAALDALASEAVIQTTSVSGSPTLFTASALTTPADGQIFSFIPYTNAAAGASLAINGTTPLPIIAHSGAPIIDDELLGGTPYILKRIGTTYRLLTEAPQEKNYETEFLSDGSASILLQDPTDGPVDGGIVVDFNSDRAVQTEAFANGFPLSAPSRFRRVGDADAIDPQWWSGGRSVHAALAYASAHRRKLVLKDAYELDEFLAIPSNSWIEFYGDAQLTPIPSGYSGRAIIQNADDTLGNSNITLVRPRLVDPGNLGLIASAYFSCADGNMQDGLRIIDADIGNAQAANLLLRNATNIEIQGGKFYSAGTFGINGDNLGNTTIRGIRAFSNLNDAIRIDKSVALWLEDSQLFSNGDPRYSSLSTDANGWIVGETVTSSAGGTATVESVVGTLITVDPDSVVGTIANGNTLTGGSSGTIGTVVAFNFERGRGNGLLMGNDGTFSNGSVFIKNNLIYNNGKSGTSLFGPAHVEHIGNRAYRNGDTALDAIGYISAPLTYALYLGNECYENRDFGIHCGTAHPGVSESDTAIARSIIIVDNNCRDNGHNPSTGLDSHVPTRVAQIGIDNSNGIGSISSVTISRNTCVSGSFLADAVITIDADVVLNGSTITTIIVTDNILSGYTGRPIEYLNAPANIEERGNKLWGGPPRVTLDTTATPSIAGFDHFELPAGPDVTDFVHDQNNKRIMVYWTGARTLVHGTNINLVGGVDFAGVAGNIMELWNRNGVWLEVFRRT